MYHFTTLMDYNYMWSVYKSTESENCFKKIFKCWSELKLFLFLKSIIYNGLGRVKTISFFKSIDNNIPGRVKTISFF